MEWHPKLKKYVLGISLLALNLISCGSTPTGDIAGEANQSRVEALFSFGQGKGSSRDEAVEKALLDAIRGASGVFLSDHVLIEQNELRSHEVIQYSAGYVRSFEILDERQDETGSYEVSLNAFVSKSALLKFFSGSAHGEGGDLAGDKVYHSIKREIDRRDSRIALLSHLMDDYPVRMYKVRLLDQKTRFTEDRRVFVDLSWQISWSEAFLAALYEHFKEMADEVCPMIHDYNSYYYSYDTDSCGQFSFIEYEDFGFMDRVAGKYGISFKFNDEKYVQTVRRIIDDQHRAYSAGVGVYFSFLNQEGIEVINACINTQLTSDNYSSTEFMVKNTWSNIFFRNQTLSWNTSIEMEDVNWLKSVESIKLSLLKRCE